MHSGSSESSLLAAAVQPERARPALGDEPHWYRDAVIYQAHVRGFFDSNDDGIGDLPGLTHKLDYIQSLGVSAIWLQPFYPSPLKDDGYDIAHYEGVHPSYGTRRDFVAFLTAAHDRGLRVITELVINHTSDQHPWFQAARRARRGTSKRNFYVWSDTDQRYLGVPIVFKDTEPSNWTWDPVAGQYYWHRFFHHQPDLNFDNPSVVKALLKVMHFWLDLGVDGMRLDAVPYLVERDGTQCANLPETHAILKLIRRELDARYPNRMLLAEANQWPSDVRAYFGDADECHMAFHFPLMPRLFMALRQEDRHPLSEILYQMPDIPDTCQWAIFLRNHDELTLEMVSDEERDYMYQAYAADPQMRVNAGIRRRLAPLVENSRPRIELLTGLLLSLPGTPVIYYGDEIGMGDNVYLGDRNGVRTPMQWSADRNGGFSRADPARLYLPPIMDSVYGFASVNVEAQERSPHSLLAWMRRTISLRQTHATFGRGTMELLRPANRRIFAFIRRLESHDAILVVANLSRTVQAVSLDLGRLAGLIPVEMSGGVELPRISEAPYVLTLGPHAFYWLKLQREAPSAGARPIVVAPELEPEQSPLLIGPEWWKILDGSVRRALETRYLPPFLVRQPWFERSGSALTRVTISDWGTLRAGDEPVFVMVLSASFAEGTETRYLMPVALTAGERAAEIARDTPDAVIVGIAGARRGVMHTRLDGSTGRILVAAALDNRHVRLRHGHLHAFRLSGVDTLALPDRLLEQPPAPLDIARFPSHASFGERLMLKATRRIWPGPSPERELATFLTSVKGFRRVPVPAGAIEYEDPSGGVATVGLVSAYVPHQSDGWRNAVDEITRFFDVAATMDAPASAPARLPGLWSSDVPQVIARAMSAHTQTAAVLGQRVADLHIALASDEAAQAFGTAHLDAARIAILAERVSAGWERARAGLLAATPATDAGRLLRQQLIDRHDRIVTAARSAREAIVPGLQLIRTHGSLDLAHALIYEGDFWFVGLEDDETDSVASRRQLRSALEDIANLVWSWQRAGHTALAARLATSPLEADRLSTWMRWCVAAAAATFLGIYRRATEGMPFVPADQPSAVALLQLLLYERAFTDIRRSQADRSGWLEITIAAALGLTEE
jgi:maltose alpha-D-glucosyltransferase/alpha-amylase